jgi:hypothetical protein
VLGLQPVEAMIAQGREDVLLNVGAVARLGRVGQVRGVHHVVRPPSQPDTELLGGVEGRSTVVEPLPRVDRLAGLLAPPPGRAEVFHPPGCGRSSGGRRDVGSEVQGGRRWPWSTRSPGRVRASAQALVTPGRNMMS